MEQIFPLEAGNIERFRGQLVCVIMQDGTRHIGRLSAVRRGRICLNEDAGGGAQLSHAGHHKKRTKRSVRRRHREHEHDVKHEPLEAADPYTVYPPHGNALYGRPVELELALVAYLFLLLI